MRAPCLLPALFLLIAASSVAQDHAELGKALVGSWVSADSQVMEFRADKTFRMYPKCGGEAAAWKKRGLTFLPATWEIVEGNHLKLTMMFLGMSRTMDATIALVDNDMRFTDNEGHVSVNRHYSGELPPVCSANPSH
jgi:hypothetical protein